MPTVRWRPWRPDDAMQLLLDHPLVRRMGLRARLRATVDAARAGIAFREDTHFYGTRTLPVLRRALLEMGRRLTDAGMLRDRAEVFHLRLEELEELPDPVTAADVDAERIRGTVLRRSARREELSGVPLISSAVLFPDTAGDADTIVKGTPAAAAAPPVRCG